jgi:TatD DNase family protein
MIDSHAHLADPAFDEDREDVIRRAREAGLAGVVCIGESMAAAARARELATRHSGFVFWTAGIHPHDAVSFDATADLAVITDHIANGAVAVGECGLDYYYDHSPRERQRRAFAEQLTLARSLNRPVVVHTREAEVDTRAMVREAGQSGVRGVMHCFTGSHELARAALDVNWLISFSGIITFKRWSDDALLRLVPEDRLLVETDAPYLAPVPHRGKRNEPSYLARTMERLAVARGVAASNIARVTAANARALFGLATAQPA